MIILRNKTFSREKDNKSIKQGALGAGGALVANTILVAPSMIRQVKGDNRVYTPEQQALSDKLIAEAKKRGIKVSPEGGGFPGPSYYRGCIFRDGSYNPTDIAHELGHAHFDVEKGAGTRIGKVAHKVYLGGGGTYGFVRHSRNAAILAGISSGISKARAEKQGKEENKVARHAAWAAPVLVASPMLISEAAASAKGLRYLKNAGGKKGQLLKSGAQLGQMWGTYGTLAAANAGLGELSRGISYRIARKIEKDESKKKLRNESP